MPGSRLRSNKLLNISNIDVWSPNIMNVVDILCRHILYYCEMGADGRRTNVFVPYDYPQSSRRYLYLFGVNGCESCVVLMYLNKASRMPRSIKTFRKLSGNQEHMNTATTDTSR